MGLVLRGDIREDRSVRDDTVEMVVELGADRIDGMYWPLAFRAGNFLGASLVAERWLGFSDGRTEV